MENQNIPHIQCIKWFNFKVSQVDVDTHYEFEIGPFKKSRSKFEKGMFPWVADLNNPKDKYSRFPVH